MGLKCTGGFEADLTAPLHAPKLGLGTARTALSWRLKSNTHTNKEGKPLLLKAQPAGQECGETSAGQPGCRGEPRAAA